MSEVMLQQTQVSRVLSKYGQWLEAFPDVASLAASSLKDALGLWSGLGYNRRGKWLREAAIAIRDRHGGRVPDSAEELDGLPGIGEYTSKAIVTFAFGKAEAFIETNIRRVFIHFFFSGRDSGEKVRDAEILPLVAESLDHEDPRHWYYALMDYGAGLAKYVENPNRKSAVYSVQAPLRGSNREARGAILKSISRGKRTMDQVAEESGIGYERLEKALEGLVSEGIVAAVVDGWEIAD